jgi:quinol monooxygenase YgiN
MTTLDRKAPLEIDERTTGFSHLLKVRPLPGGNMTYLTVQHKVRDYKSWKETFDNFEGTRRSGGEKSYHIMHSEDDPNNLYLMFEWDSPENAHSFFKSPELKDAMKRAGVVDQPKINYLSHLDQGKL